MTKNARLCVAAGLCAVAVTAAVPALPGRTLVAAGQVQGDTVPRISMADFRKLFDAGDVLVIDVRGAEAYKIGHIPGAILVPEETIAQRAKEWLTEKRPIVTYCAWPAEHTSARAALELQKAGVKNARALTGGIGGWVSAGHPVVTGTNPK